MFPGECVGSEGMACPVCGKQLPFQVCQSAAGFYLGYICPGHGPMSRESVYFATREEAEVALKNPDKHSRFMEQWWP